MGTSCTPCRLARGSFIGKGYTGSLSRSTCAALRASSRFRTACARTTVERPPDGAACAQAKQTTSCGSTKNVESVCGGKVAELVDRSPARSSERGETSWMIWPPLDSASGSPSPVRVP
jgi:hypothetical protein